MRTPNWQRLVVLLLISIAAFAGQAARGHGQSAAPPPAVLVQPAELRVLARQAEFIGRVQAVDKVELRARVQGFLGPRQFEDGAEVKAGQTLFIIERGPFEAALEQRKAQLASAESTLQNATLQLARARELESRQAVSRAILDDRIADEARARAAVLEAQAAVKDAEIKLSYTEIKSPITGRVGRAAVSPGNLVGPDSGVLATVVRQDRMYVLFPVTQRELIEARRVVGNNPLTVRVKLADGTLAPDPGTIDFLDVQVDPRTDGQIVRAVFSNAGSFLTDSQTVRVVLEQQGASKVVTIPQAAIATDQAGQFVYVVGKNNVVEQRRIKTGQGREGYAAVEEGVSAGDLVIVQGQQRVRPGMTVVTQTMPAPAR